MHVYEGVFLGGTAVGQMMYATLIGGALEGNKESSYWMAASKGPENRENPYSKLIRNCVTFKDTKMTALYSDKPICITNLT